MAEPFTPGPWVVREPNPYTATIVKELSPAHVRIIASLVETSSQCVADARLIAAAPELYEATEVLTELVDAFVSSSVTLNAIRPDLAAAWRRCAAMGRATLAKARGEP